MSLPTLCALEQQFVLTLEAAKRHVDAPGTRGPSSTPSPDVCDQFLTVASAIERLQTELQCVTSLIVSDARQRFTIQTTATESIAEASAISADAENSETETEDENPEAQPRQHGPDEEIGQPKQTRDQHIKKERWPEALQRFVEATDEAVASLKTNQQKLKAPIVTLPFPSCRSATNILVAMLEDGDGIDDNSAALYRDAAAKLMPILADERTHRKIPGKVLTTVINRLGEVVSRAGSGGIPAALSDSVLKKTLHKLKQFVEDHDGDVLKRMQTLIQRQKSDIVGKKLETCIGILVSDVHSDTKSRLIKDKMGLAARTEEHWATFMEVTDTLGNWIGRMAMNAKPPKQMRNAMGSIKMLNKQFPGRVAPSLLENAGLRLRFSRSVMRAEKKKAKAM
ncbi:hypothetical protein PHYBOEH_001214 [Phytophthora boehmeriae]|uniref:Uncharacterized protein n=1 Tax=Phytophthora boehmeriae TaxID=109152 RepID=A0A8T1V6S2_9STRA|nr:hypothetical protein PHYBOEH_001214 [Phytophthora boehmeriae]